MLLNFRVSPVLRKLRLSQFNFNFNYVYYNVNLRQLEHTATKCSETIYLMSPNMKQFKSNAV